MGELDGRRIAPGEPGRAVRGLALDEEADRPFGPDEAAVTSREELNLQFLDAVARAGSPAVVWRSKAEPSEEAARRIGELGLGLVALPPDVPLRKILPVADRDGGGGELLRYSHASARALLVCTHTVKPALPPSPGPDAPGKAGPARNGIAEAASPSAFRSIRHEV